MEITDKDISINLILIDKEINSYVTIWDDNFYGGSYYLIIRKDEDPKERSDTFASTGRSYKLKEVYDLSKDLAEQLASYGRSTKYYLKSCDIVDRALKFATENHFGQFRKDGREYISHPINVLNYVKKYCYIGNVLEAQVAALLHDLIEDTSVTYKDIFFEFGEDIANLVMELTNDEERKNSEGKAAYLTSKMIDMSYLALMIKLCDRLDNVSSLKNLEDYNFIYRYISETLIIMNQLKLKRNLSLEQISIIEEIERVASVVALNINRKRENSTKNSNYQRVFKDN